MLTSGVKYFLKSGKKYLQSVLEYYIIKTVRKALKYGGMKMLTRDFLMHIQPTMKVIQFDQDARGGNFRKEDEAGALAVAHHFDYDSYVVDFMIEPDHVTIFIKRNKEDK